MPLKSQGKPLAKSRRKTAETPVPPPDWPALRPLIASEDLSLETLLKDQVVVIRGLLTSILCRTYVSFLSSLPLITTPVQPKAGNAVRVNDRIQLDDPAFAEQLWSSTALGKLVKGSNEEVDAGSLTIEEAKDFWGGEVCGLNPRIRIYRYCNLPSPCCFHEITAD